MSGTDTKPYAEGGPPLDELAYEQASHALDQQAGVLNELRQRTSTLVAVTALVATFLGGQGLKAPAADQGPGIVLALALAMLLLGVAACLAVLLPTRTRRRDAGERGRSRRAPEDPEDVLALSFALNVEVMLNHADDRGVKFLDTARMAAARTLQRAWDENHTIISEKQRAFVWACVALLVQTASWITFIALGEGVI